MNKYDLVVIGGGTAGCAAAYTAGKLGLKTLLIEKAVHLGGSITSGLVIPAMNCGENQINTDFFNELIIELKNLGGQITYQDNPGWFNPELTKIALDKMMRKSNVDVRFNTSVKEVILNENSINSIILDSELLSTYNYKIQNYHKSNDKTLSLSNEEIYSNNIPTMQNRLSSPIETRYVIDATGNCEFAKICNCEFLDSENETQPVSMRFIMSNIDLEVFAQWLEDFDKDRNVTTVERIDGHIHLSTAYTWDTNKQWALAPLFNDAVSKGVLKDTDRNYFQIFTIAGMPNSIAFNCPRMLENIDLRDTQALSKGIISGRESILRVSDFCKKYLPGFENSFISNIADMLGIRVSRRIKGKYIYTIEDLKSGKKFENPVLISNYPIDIHSAKRDTSTLQTVQEYQLPIESLISADIDNLFVAGRCISADFMAQGALRVQPSCFAMGEGVAKYISTL